MRPNHNRRLSNFQIGLIAIVLTFVGFYLAFTKSIPFAGHGYQLKAVFQDAQNIRDKSPVRISGVNVGEVSDVQHVTDANGNGEDAAMVTMDIKDNALPIRQDATLQLRPRLFLEGNLFVDLHPGSPGAPELRSGSVVPETQTSASVQLDQVLSTLQAPVREDLQIFLKEFGGALDQYGGAQGLQTSFRTSPAAYRYLVGEALGERDQAGLGGRVDRLTAHAGSRGDGGDEDHPAPAPRDHAGQEQPGQLHRRGQVDGHELGDLLGGDVTDQAGPAQSRVVDQDVDPGAAAPSAPGAGQGGRRPLGGGREIGRPSGAARSLASAMPPVWSATACRRAGSRPAISSRTPSAASARAVAAPMPDEPPVTSATAPVSRMAPHFRAPPRLPQGTAAVTPADGRLPGGSGG